MPHPANADVIDLGDATLMPGFIDAHVHWHNSPVRTGITTGSTASCASPRAGPVRRAVCQGHAGGRRHHGARPGSSDYIALGLRNAIDAGAIPGPRMLIANYAIGATAATPIKTRCRRQRIAVAGPLQGVCNGPEECREAVRYQIKYART